MPDFNRVMLIGRLSRDPEMRYTPGNQAVTCLSVAVNSRWKNKAGEQQEEVTFVDCEAWGKTAEVMAQHLKKGRPVFIEGRLKLEQWDDKATGQKRSRMKVVVENFQFIDSNQARQDAPGSTRGPIPAKSTPGVRDPQQEATAADAMPDDDLPF